MNKVNMNMNVLNGQLKDHGVSIDNAGLVIIAVYLPMLFNRLGYLSDDRRITSSTSKRKAGVAPVYNSSNNSIFLELDG